MDNPILTPIHVLKARQLQAVNLICLLLTFIIQRRPTNTKLVKLPTRKVILERIVVREELMCNLLNGGQCRDLIRMSENAFMRLCDILKGEGGLRPMQRMSIDEHVARFFHIVGNDLRTRLTSWMYGRSRSTTSKCFHKVLRAIISIESHYIQQPKGDVVPKEFKK